MLKGMMWAERFLEGGKKALLPYRDNHVGPVRLQKPRSDLPGFVYSTTTLQCNIFLRIRRRIALSVPYIEEKGTVRSKINVDLVEPFIIKLSATLGNYVFGMYLLKLCCIVLLMSWVGTVGVVITAIGGIGFGLL